MVLEQWIPKLLSSNEAYNFLLTRILKYSLIYTQKMNTLAVIQTWQAVVKFHLC